MQDIEIKIRQLAIEYSLNLDKQMRAKLRNAE